MTIDTLAYVKTLEAAGVDRKATGARAAALGKALTADYVTKSYKAEIASVKSDVSLMKWMLGKRMLGFGLALRAAIRLKLLS